MNTQTHVNSHKQTMAVPNFEVWKNIYEEFYGIPLEYTTVKEEVNEEI